MQWWDQMHTFIDLGQSVPLDNSLGLLIGADLQLLGLNLLQNSFHCLVEAFHQVINVWVHKRN